jgi:hypothetical protein
MSVSKGEKTKDVKRGIAKKPGGEITRREKVRRRK